MQSSQRHAVAGSGSPAIPTFPSRARINWKYALGLELTDPGFDFSALSEFCGRLVEGDSEHLLLGALLEACKERSYLMTRGRQRMDSTHVLGALRTLSRLEWAAETMRAALNAMSEHELRLSSLSL